MKPIGMVGYRKPISMDKVRRSIEVAFEGKRC